MRCVVFGLLLVSGTLWAQDAGLAALQASQQAADAAQLATQQAQQANQQAMQASQQAAQAAAQASGGYDNAQCLSPKPTFSLKPGTYQGAQSVVLLDKGRHAELYYTVDGWTPTQQSQHFLAPISVASTTVLKARAYTPGCEPSLVAEAEYTLPGAQPAPPPVVQVSAEGVLRKGTPLPFDFVSPLNSETARVGEPVPLRLAAPLQIGTRVLPAGTVQALAYVIEVHRPAKFGQPGEIRFALHSMEAEGVSVALTGERSAEGKDAYNKTRSIIFIPAVGLSALAIHGTDAAIAAGASVTGEVAADTRLPLLPEQSAVTSAPAGTASQ